MNNIATGSPRDFQYTLPIQTPRAAFWELWTDVGTWSSWDTPLQSATLAAPMQLGTKGSLTTKNGQTSEFIISQFQALDSYTMTTPLPLGQLEIQRFLTEKNGQLEFTHRVRFLGLSAGLFAALLGKGFMQELPVVMQNLKTMAEKS